MSLTCDDIASRHRRKIDKVVQAQVQENREAIFFIYEDGSTSDIYRGEATQISLSRDQEAHIMSQGEIVGSVHSHPSGFDPSTIDIMTGLMTTQRSMCVATPVHQKDVEEDYVLTCLDLSELSMLQRRRMMRAMRRSSTGVTDLGRQFRKQAALQRFDVDGCRTHTVKVEGVEFPVTDRPSRYSFVLGDERGVSEELEGEDILD